MENKLCGVDSSPPADVKLFRRRGKELGLGDGVFSYAEVKPDELSEAYGRIFKAEKIAAAINTAAATCIK